MRVGHLSLFLSLCIALVTGVVPMRVCRPTDGCAGGVVAVGQHAHGDHDDPSQGGGGAPSGSCVDAPFTLGLPATPVTLDAPRAAEPLPVALREVVLVESAILAPGRRFLDVGVPLGTRSVVLLR